MAEERSVRELNIYQKLAIVQSAVDIVKKDSDGFKFKYTSEEELLPKITSKMFQVGLNLIPRIIPGTARIEPRSYTQVKRVRDNSYEEIINEFFMSAEVEFTWVNTDNPEETVTIPWFMTGNQSDSSQTFGSALTYSERYFLLKFFQVATTADDPDALRSEQKKAIAKSDVAGILDEVDSIVQEAIAASPDAAKDITALVTKFADVRDEHGNLVETKNYFNITKKARATGLLNALKKKYNK